MTRTTLARRAPMPMDTAVMPHALNAAMSPEQQTLVDALAMAHAAEGAGGS